MVLNNHLLNGRMMTLVTFDNGKVLMRQGLVAVGVECCCCSGCQCGDTFPTQISNVPEFSITTTNGGSFQVCLSGMAADNSAEGAAPQQLRCGPGPDTEFPARKCVYYIVWYDGTCYHRIYFSLANFPDCDCSNGDNCDIVIEGWENYSAGCAYSISAIEIVSVGTC